MRRNYVRYQVALKLLLWRGRKVLFLKLAGDRRWDLPGGRIDQGEERVPLRNILAREVREELGPSLRYQLREPLFQFRRRSRSLGVYNFLTAYEGHYRSGKIRLSSEHESYQWLDPRRHKFSRKDFFNREEYLAFKRYLKFR